MKFEHHTLFVLPAYGRRYQTEEALRKDWEEGKDFKIVSGPYLSIRDQDKIKEIYAVAWGPDLKSPKVRLK